jgi:hypothetical protein
MFLNNFSWPIYSISSDTRIWEENNVLYLTTAFGVKYILDNKNLSGNTLGVRRLRLRKLGTDKLYTFKGIYCTMYDVFSSKHKIFIDSKGELLTLTKKTRRTLIYKKVIGTWPGEEGHLMCQCEDVFPYIEIPFLPKVMPKYLGLLRINHDYVLYELSDTKKKDTWRKW